jgi:hypothetical protein
VSGLTFKVKSTAAITNGRALALRPNENFLAPSPGSSTGNYLVGLDTSSSTLFGNLRQGILYNETRSSAGGNITDLPSAGYLYPSSTGDPTTLYSPLFASAQVQPLDSGWYLAAAADGTKTTTYNLLHNSTDANQKAAWLLCLATDDLDYGPWYSLFYATYNGTVQTSGCEVVSLQTNLTAADQTC